MEPGEEDDTIKPSCGMRVKPGKTQGASTPSSKCSVLQAPGAPRPAENVREIALEIGREGGEGHGQVFGTSWHGQPAVTQTEGISVANTDDRRARAAWTPSTACTNSSHFAFQSFVFLEVLGRGGRRVERP